MSTDQVLSFLRALDLRLEEVERDLKEAESLQQDARSRDLGTERAAISALKSTFLKVLQTNIE